MACKFLKAFFHIMLMYKYNFYFWIYGEPAGSKKKEKKKPFCVMSQTTPTL